ncbi:MAG: Bug family tripartite tricarboxylate transporter substrate binding protein [bacterium]
MRRLPGFLLLCLLGTNCFAQAWPNRPMRLVIPFAPGGGADIAGRLIAQELGEVLKQPMLVENRTGAGGTLALDYVAKSPADGYSIALGHLGGIAIAPSLFKTLPFDPMRDLIPVSLAVNGLSVLVVTPTLPVKTVADLVAHAKANPGKLSYGSAGTGTDTHLAGELFASMTGTTMTHIAYKGGAPALVDLIGGQIDLTFQPLPEALPHLRGGRVRPLAMTSAKRSASAPDIPTVSESGLPGFTFTSWMGTAGPAGMPAALTAQISADWNKALNAPEVRPRLIEAGLDIAGGTPEQFAAHMRSEVDAMMKLVKESGIPPVE